MTGTADLDILARVRHLEQRVRDLSRVRSLPPPNLRDLRDLDVAQVQNGQGVVYDSTTGRWKPARVTRARVTGSGTQTFTSNTEARVAFATAPLNVGLTWDSANNRLVVPTGADGFYLGAARTMWNGFDDTGYITTHLILNEGTGGETVLDDDHPLGDTLYRPGQTSRFEVGTAALSFSAAAAVSGSVTFANAFATTPRVTLTGEDAANLDLVCSVTARSTTGFSYRCAVRNSTPVTTSATLHWHAAGITTPAGFLRTNHVVAAFDLVAGDTVCCHSLPVLVDENGGISGSLTTTLGLADSWMSLSRLGAS